MTNKALFCLLNKKNRPNLIYFSIENGPDETETTPTPDTKQKNSFETQVDPEKNLELKRKFQDKFSNEIKNNILELNSSNNFKYIFDLNDDNLVKIKKIVIGEKESKADPIVREVTYVALHENGVPSMPEIMGVINENTKEELTTKEAKDKMDTKIQEIFKKYETMSPANFMEQVTNASDLHNKIFKEAQEFISNLKLKKDELTAVSEKIEGFQMISSGFMEWMNDSWSTRVFWEKQQENKDHNYKKYKSSLKYISDYMNGTGIEYLKTNIKNGNINSLNSFNDAVKRLFSDITKATEKYFKSNKEDVSYDIIVNNVRYTINFNKQGKVAVNDNDIKKNGLNLMNEVFYKNKEIRNSNLGRFLKMDDVSEKEELEKQLKTLEKQSRTEKYLTSTFKKALNRAIHKHWSTDKFKNTKNIVIPTKSEINQVESEISTQINEILKKYKIDTSILSNGYYTGWFEFQPNLNSPKQYFSMCFDNGKPVVMHSEHIGL